MQTLSLTRTTYRQKIRINWRFAESRHPYEESFASFYPLFSSRRSRMGWKVTEPLTNIRFTALQPFESCFPRTASKHFRPRVQSCKDSLTRVTIRSILDDFQSGLNSRCRAFRRVVKRASSPLAETTRRVPSARNDAGDIDRRSQTT